MFIQHPQRTSLQDDRIRQSLGGGKGLDTAVAAGTVALQKQREKTLEELLGFSLNSVVATPTRPFSLRKCCNGRRWLFGSRIVAVAVLHTWGLAIIKH